MSNFEQVLMLTNSVRDYAAKLSKKLCPTLNRFRCSQIQ
eukprot:UN18369